MAEEVVTNEVQEVEEVTETVSKAEYDELNAKLTQYKRSIDKLTKEAADKKREERARMSEEERIKAEQDEEFARLREKAEADAKELNHLKAINAYKGVDSEVVEKLVDAINDKDHNAIAALVEKVVEKAIKEKEAEWKKSRPSAFIGDGVPTMTKEQILAIKDPTERQRKIAENLSLFT